MPNNKTAARGGLWTRDFLLVWQGMAESRIGSVLYSIAIGIWVYNKTGSAALMGFMTSLSYFGALVLQPFGGALADRCSKRALMIGSDAVCGVAMLALGGLALCGAMQVWQVLAVAAVSAVCTALFQPAVNSLIPQLVPAGDLLRASSLINGTGSALQMLGNAAGGFLTVVCGVPGIILFNGLTFLFSAATECFIRAGRAPAGSGAPGPAAVLGDLRAGICYLKGQGGLAGMMLAGATMNLTCGGFAGIAYAWCLEKGMSTGQYGLFLGAESAAMLAAMALMALRPIPGNRQYRVFAGSMALTCGLYIAAMAAQGFWACTVLYALNAFFNTVYNMFLYPSIMRATPAAYQGRVIALFAALSNGGIALSMVAYGALADAWGAGAVCLAGAVATLLPALAFGANRTLRRILRGQGAE